jgi:hypothetical protein
MAQQGIALSEKARTPNGGAENGIERQTLAAE